MGRTRITAAILGMSLVVVTAVAFVVAGPGRASGCPAPGATSGQQAPAQPSADVLPLADTGTGPLRSAAQWASLFDQFWQGERSTQEALSRSRDSWDHYELSYSVDALTSAYLATGRREYVDEALSLTENVVASAVRSASLPNSQYHDAYLGWASKQESGEEVPLYESYFWRYGTRLLRVIHATPALAEDPALQPRYARLVAFAERDVFEKWYRRGPDDNIYRSRTHMAAHWAFIAMNLADITTNPADRTLYRTVQARIDKELHGQLIANPRDPGAYFWSDVWGSCRQPGQDVSHGNGVIAYVADAHDQGGAWSDADVARFVRTLADVVWPTEGPGSAFVDGSGEGNGWFSDGFVKLGRYDAALQRRLETHQPANDQFYANGALNAAILLCHGSAGESQPTAVEPPPACTENSSAG